MWSYSTVDWFLLKGLQLWGGHYLWSIYGPRKEEWCTSDRVMGGQALSKATLFGLIEQTAKDLTKKSVLCNLLPMLLHSNAIIGIFLQTPYPLLKVPTMVMWTLYLVQGAVEVGAWSDYVFFYILWKAATQACISSPGNTWYDCALREKSTPAEMVQIIGQWSAWKPQILLSMQVSLWVGGV